MARNDEALWARYRFYIIQTSAGRFESVVWLGDKYLGTKHTVCLLSIRLKSKQNIPTKKLQCLWPKEIILKLLLWLLSILSECNKLRSVQLRPFVASLNPSATGSDGLLVASVTLACGKCHTAIFSDHLHLPSRNIKTVGCKPRLILKKLEQQTDVFPTS